MNLNDVIASIESSQPKDVKDVALLKATLIELRDMIGNAKTKDTIAKHVNMLLVKKKRGEDITSMLNTVIYGSPGVGKTKIGCKIAAIYYSLGLLKSGSKKQIPLNDMMDLQRNEYVVGFITLMTIFLLIWAPLQMIVQYIPTWAMIVLGVLIFFGVLYLMWLTSSKTGVKETNMASSAPDHRNIVEVVSREDFIGEYLGSTEPKTFNLLQRNQGKVLFIDEAYSLYNGHHDMYGMEALTVINRFMSEHPGEIIIIFAGYRKNLEEGIFRVQPGLPRRCMFHLEVFDYTADELFLIFESQIRAKGYQISDPVGSLKLFQDNYDAFPSFGGDCERCVEFCMMEQCSDNTENLEITLDQLARGIRTLRENNISRPKTSETISSRFDWVSALDQFRSQVV
jgi:hypothetical protein